MALPVRWSWSEDSDAAGERKRQATNADIRRRNCPIPRRMPMARRGWRPCCGVDVVIARKIGRAHVWTPVTNAQHVCRRLLEQKKTVNRHLRLTSVDYTQKPHNHHIRPSSLNKLTPNRYK